MKLISYSRTCVNIENLIDQQVNYISSWAQENGHSIEKEFKDEGMSGFSTKRMGFESLINYALKYSSQVDGIVVYNMSRFSRNQEQSNRIIAKLHSVGIELVSCSPLGCTEEKERSLIRNVYGLSHKSLNRE